MTKQLTVNVAVASLVYWVVTAYWQTGGLGFDVLVQTLPGAIVFALIYGALQVALILFRRKGK